MAATTRLRTIMPLLKGQLHLEHLEHLEEVAVGAQPCDIPRLVGLAGCGR